MNPFCSARWTTQQRRIIVRKGQKERRKGAHLWASQLRSSGHWGAGVNQSPPPPRKTGTLRPVCDSLNQSTGVMSASTNLTPFTLWPVKHRNAINKWLQGVLMILVLYFYTTGRHLSVRPGEQHLDAANHANRFLKLWARLTDGWKHSRTVSPNDCTPCSDTDTYGLTGELNNHNNIWQHFYTGSKSQGTRLKNTKKCKNTCMW